MKSINRTTGSLRRGITILELLITASGFVIVGGLAFAIYDSTLSTSRKMIDRSSAIEHSMVLIDTITTTLDNAVSPQDLEKAKGHTVFSRGELTVPAWDRASNKIVLVEYKLDTDRIDQPPLLNRQTYELDGEEPIQASFTSMDNRNDVYVSTIRFQYAMPADLKAPGEPIAWRDFVEPDQWPALVRVHVDVSTRRNPDRNYAVRTVIRTGHAAEGDSK